MPSYSTGTTDADRLAFRFASSGSKGTIKFANIDAKSTVARINPVIITGTVKKLLSLLTDLLVFISATVLFHQPSFTLGSIIA